MNKYGTIHYCSFGNSKTVRRWRKASEVAVATMSLDEFLNIGFESGDSGNATERVKASLPE